MFGPVVRDEEVLQIGSRSGRRRPGASSRFTHLLDPKWAAHAARIEAARAKMLDALARSPGLSAP